MGRRSKEFVRNIIIVAVVGLILLMVLLFMVLRAIFADHPTVSSYNQPAETEAVHSNVELSENSVVLVHSITETSLSGYDIKNNKSINKAFSDTTRISDGYGNVIPASEIRPGDIIEMECDQENGSVFSVKKASDVQSWKKISGITVDQENESINVGGGNYKYMHNTMILKSDGTNETINNIGPYDIVSIQVYNDRIWSIKVEEACASISVSDLPISQGTIELDYSRLINFSDITEPIKVIPGKHKLVIRMQGYEVITKEITVASSEEYALSLADAKRAYTNVTVRINSGIKDYQLQIGDRTYGPGDQIKLVQGTYTVNATAEGYEPWSKKVTLSEDDYMLRISMIPIETEEDEEDQEGTEEATEDQTAVNSRTVTISTDPTGANIYIDGAKRGETPYTATLTYGNHSIIFEKEGYEIYSTSVEINSSDDQTDFLYMLVQN